MNIEFKDRLIGYRTTLGFLEKQQMADKLGIGPALYSLLESGTRNPSKNVLNKLNELTGKDDAYWLYGIEDSQKHFRDREDWKFTTHMLETLYKSDLLISANDEINPKVLEMLIESISVDAKYKVEKDKANGKKVD